eukprot:TRINITY_DN8004_c1_g1_i1.p1 TRINITY_DN8004_c1_g1~~TRINITY_DN8004_c1_g1_i1.p1  ORF type:complete len:545 (+),score=70.73 TRINITY_DN8004_c1_g1_i1:46-1680(+)
MSVLSRLSLTWGRVLVVAIVCFIIRAISPRIRRLLPNRKAKGWGGRVVEVVKTDSECQQFLRRMIEEAVTESGGVIPIGLDCEWGSSRISLIQISSGEHTAIIQLSVLQQIPSSLRHVLEDSRYLKMGAAIQGDANRLLRDWNVILSNWLCLQHVCKIYDLSPTGLSLQKMSHTLCGISLYKGHDVRLTNWDQPSLTRAQVTYAGNDAIASYEVGARIAALKGFDSLMMHRNQSSRSKNSSVKPTAKTNKKVRKVNKFSATTKKTYDNVVMQADDGEPLVCCDRKKAEWYLKKDLATIVCNDPLVIRLTFKPIGRNTTADTIDHKCVVCGVSENLLKHHVVPVCFRQKFPEHRKAHQPHDIVLTCNSCSALCQRNYDVYRENLFKEYNVTARLPSREQHIKSCASALASMREKVQSLDDAVTYPEADTVKPRKIPRDRFEYLKDTISEELSVSPADLRYQHLHHLIEKHTLLPTSSQVVTKILSANGEPGLDTFVQGWRQKFVDTMSPKHLPLGWSVHHVFIDERRKEGYVPPYLRTAEDTAGN